MQGQEMRPRKYPWKEWFTRPTTVRRGRDYRCSQSSIVQQARNAAVKLGVKVHLEDKGTYVKIVPEVHGAQT